MAQPGIAERETHGGSACRKRKRFVTLSKKYRSLGPNAGGKNGSKALLALDPARDLVGVDMSRSFHMVRQGDLSGNRPQAGSPRAWSDHAGYGIDPEL